MRKLMLVIPIFLLLLSSPAHAESKWFSWDETNTKLHVPLTLLMFADYRQTLYNEKHYYRNKGALPILKDGKYVFSNESNSTLGKYPSRKEIHRYFAKAMLACTIIPFILPPTSSYIFQGGVITIEVDVVNGNYSLGATYFF